ncbi:MAG: endoribonuclease ysh1 [Sclerophora amabilis]|nr:MAG: endoribonuclease ysh1 [Sclerophora amabilis]
MAAKRKLSALNPASEDVVDPADQLMFFCLGGGNEVGRSCHILQYKGKTVMLDAGMHPAYDGLAALPFYDEFDLSTVDVLLISHFHLDHSQSLPYVLSKTNFEGRVFMTHPTKAIYKWLLQDSVRVGNALSSTQQAPIYTESDHLSTFPKIETIDYHTTHTISSIRITPYPAGHVLGAAMFLIEIAGLKILFTGDYSREEDRHLIPAEVPKGIKIDVLITESTFGIASSIPRAEKETALMKSITGILHRGGRVLMPVFALGNAQELMLILDEYWSRHPELKKTPIYYASNLARKCMVVYQTYIGAMNNNIKRIFRERMAEAESTRDASQGGPWDFKHIRALKDLTRFDDVGSCVVLANPGMFQPGISRELLERWAPDQKNGVIITGYSIEGTLARSIMTEPEQIPAVMHSSGGRGGRTRVPGASGEGDKVMIPRRCSVEELSFAAHVDGVENRGFIEEVAAPVVILVHGEQHNMMRLKSKLLSLNADKSDKDKVKVFSPRNCEELMIPFKADKTAKVVGKLAQIQPPQGPPGPGEEASLITGVLVQNDFKLSLMAPEDLREYAGLTTTIITCKQKLTLNGAGVELIRWALEGTFGAIDELLEESSVNNSAASKMNGDNNNNNQISNGDGAENGEVADEEIDRSRQTTSYLVMGCVKVRCRNGGEVEIEWEGNMLNDGIADAVMAVLFTVESSPAALKYSASKSSHIHKHEHEDERDESSSSAFNGPNPHRDLSPSDRLERLFMFLEAQFGSDISPITQPKLSSIPVDRRDTTIKEPKPASPGDIKKEEEATGEDAEETSDDDDDDDDVEAAELARLHKLGIPVPGVEIRVDRHVARVWLEDLEVECGNRALKDRVQAVVERAVETVAPLWVGRKKGPVKSGRE